jgi:hypothetical protein
MSSHSKSRMSIRYSNKTLALTMSRMSEWLQNIIVIVFNPEIPTYCRAERIFLCSWKSMWLFSLGTLNKNQQNNNSYVLEPFGHSGNSGHSGYSGHSGHSQRLPYKFEKYLKIYRASLSEMMSSSKFGLDKNGISTVLHQPISSKTWRTQDHARKL